MLHQVRKVSPMDLVTLSTLHKEASDALEAQVVDNFLGKYRSPSYVGLVNDFLQKFEKIDPNMSLKMHFLKNLTKKMFDPLLFSTPMKYALLSMYVLPHSKMQQNVRPFIILLSML